MRRVQEAETFFFYQISILAHTRIDRKGRNGGLINMPCPAYHQCGIGVLFISIVLLFRYDLLVEFFCVLDIFC